MARRRAFMLSASQYMQQVRLPDEFIEKSKSLSHNLLKDAVHRYHAHRHDHHKRVDTKQWKLTKEKNHISCYRRVTSKSHAPEIMALGAIAGSLEDVLHGVVNLTPEAMQIENVLAQGDLTDSRILAFLTPPSSMDPFESMTVKWVVRRHPSMAKQRDYVYLECSGMTTTPDGEPLGFLLAHSVSLAAVPEFHKDSNISRGHVSYCFLYRQRTQQQMGVEVFFKGLVHPRGGLKDRVAMGLTVDMVTQACPTSVQLAMMKKLMFCLRTLPAPAAITQATTASNRSSRSSSSNSSGASSSFTSRSRSLGAGGRQGSNSFMRRLTQRSTGSSVASSSSADELGHHRPSSDRSSMFRRSQSFDWAAAAGDTSDARACEKCNRHFNALKTKAKCQLCFQVVCSRCRDAKRVISFEESVMYPEKLALCTDCITNTNNTSASWIAAQELHELLEHLQRDENQLLESQGLRANPNPGSHHHPEIQTSGKSVDKVAKSLSLSLDFDQRATMSSEFSTRSSTSSRYVVTLRGSANNHIHTATAGTGVGLESAARVSRGISDLDDACLLAGVDEEDSGRYYSSFVVDDSDEEEEDGDRDDYQYYDQDQDRMDPYIVDSFVDDDFLFDETDEICFSGHEQEEEHKKDDN